MVDHSITRALVLVVVTWMVCGCATVNRSQSFDDDESWPLVRAESDSKTVPGVASNVAPAQQGPNKMFILKVNQIGPLDVPTDGFDFRETDKTISSAFRRWANATEHSVVWDVPPEMDAAIDPSASPIQAQDIKEAVTKVVDSLGKSGYHIHANFYSNRVIRFSGAKK
jgi:hypothetical protein